MVKINGIPTALLILVFSWLIAIFGCVAAGAVIVLQPNGYYSWIIGVLILLAGLFLSMMVRMFGNMGQLLFDIRAANYHLHQILSTNLSGINDKLNNIIDVNIKISQDVPRVIKANFDSQTETFNRNMQELSNNLGSQTKTLSRDIHELKESVNKVNISLNEDLKNQLQNQLDKLRSNLQALFDVVGQINFYAKEGNNIANQVNQDLKGHLGDSVGQINFYSKFINENINSIKEFFAQIEKHLDLKK